MGKSLYEKVFDSHTVRRLESGQYQVLMGLHLLHEVTSPQAFSMLREAGLKVLYPTRTFGACDHVIPTGNRARPFIDPVAEEMIAELEKNCGDFHINYFAPEEGEQGVMHVLGPEKGLTQPGMTICCGDSHTATHGAFGALAMGIGTSQVRDVLATQTLPLSKLKVRRVEVNGSLKPGVYAKDLILFLINRLGVQGGVGYAYEYAGKAIDDLSMEGRMTVCNMAIEGGALCGYINPDETTYQYLKGRPYAPPAHAWEQAVRYWDSIKSDHDAQYQDRVQFAADEIEPMVTWGINPGQSIRITGRIPQLSDFSEGERPVAQEALEYMGFEPGMKLHGQKIDVAFLGSCTNGRFSDFEVVARYLKASGRKVAQGVRALAVPGSQQVRRMLIEQGYDKVFEEAGFDFREAGCSMCLAMNPDKLRGREICASSSNRNFKGRQGSTQGRTLLMSPVMVAAAALAGEVVDARDLFNIAGEEV